MERKCENCKYRVKNECLNVKEICNNFLDKFEPIEKEKTMDKKYRVIKSFLTYEQGTVLPIEFDTISTKAFVELGIIEEVKEDTLESIFDKFSDFDALVIPLKHIGLLKITITDWHNKDMVKQKIELLEWLIGKSVFGANDISLDIINDKISQLQKEIK